MDSFTIVDGIVAAVVVLSALLAFSRGFTREAMAIAGWVVAAYLATFFSPAAVPLVKEIPVVGDFLADSCELSIIVSFAVIFAVALVVVSLFTPLLSSLMNNSYVSRIDQGLGFLFGVARGILLIAVAFFVYNVMIDNCLRGVLSQQNNTNFVISMLYEASSRLEHFFGSLNY